MKDLIERRCMQYELLNFEAMEKLASLISIEIDGSFTKLARQLGIDLERYKPVRYENYPFFSIYCIDRKMSTTEKEWITKFEILVYDANEIDELFKEFKLNIAINERCLNVVQDIIEVIEFPEDED
jgi:hypothetical protein